MKRALGEAAVTMAVMVICAAFAIGVFIAAFLVGRDYGWLTGVAVGVLWTWLGLTVIAWLNED